MAPHAWIALTGEATLLARTLTPFLPGPLSNPLACNTEQLERRAMSMDNMLATLAQPQTSRAQTIAEARGQLTLLISTPGNASRE